VNASGRTVGAYEAKTHLPRLLAQVAKGETITITKHGVPVAMLVPPPGRPRLTVEESIAAIRALRKQVKPLGDLTIQNLIAEGRRF
jgi:prevent-host-death family protein